MSTRAPLAAALLAAALVVASASPLAAADVIGKISYLEGKVDLVRGGSPLDAKVVKEGLALENFDLLKVGADGALEVQVTSPSAPQSTLRMGPRTQFSIEIGKVGAKQQTTLDLVAGSVAMKVARLTGSQALRVQTEATVLGVRGTDFTVTAPASGDLLIACEDGEVECTDEKGATLQVRAGEAIERRWGGRMARLDVAPGGLGQYLREWRDRQNSAISSDPLKYVKWFAWRYDSQKRKFNREYIAFGKLTREERNWKVALGLIRLWLASRQLERLHARLLELKEYCEEGGIAGRIGLLRTSTSFFRTLEIRRAITELQLWKVRAWTIEYVRRDDGHLPWGREKAR